MSQPVAKRSELPEGSGKVVTYKGTRVALFDVGGEVYAIADTCPHVGASLASGFVEGEAVVCPWHAAKFDLRTGAASGRSDVAGVRCFGVRVDGDDVHLEDLFKVAEAALSDAQSDDEAIKVASEVTL